MNKQSQGLPPTEDETKNKQFLLADTGEVLNLRAQNLGGASAVFVERTLITPSTAPNPALPDSAPVETGEVILNRWAGKS